MATSEETRTTSEREERAGEGDGRAENVSSKVASFNPCGLTVNTLSACCTVVPLRSPLDTECENVTGSFSGSVAVNVITVGVSSVARVYAASFPERRDIRNFRCHQRSR